MEANSNNDQKKEWLNAFRCVKRAKNVLLLLVVLAVLVQLSVFALVYFWGAIDAPAPSVATNTPTSVPASDSACPTVQQDSENESMLHKIGFYSDTLRISQRLPFAFILLLAMILLFNVNLSLMFKASGVSGFIGAFLWSLVLLIFIAPWDKLFSNILAQGGLFSLPELISQTKAIKGGCDEGGLIWSSLEYIIYWVRFVGLPVIVLLIVAVIQVRFRHGYKAVKRSIKNSHEQTLLDS